MKETVRNFKIGILIFFALLIIFAITHWHCKLIIHNGTLVTIRSGFLESREDIKSIEIPPEVTRIEAYAFKNCKGLEEVTIPNSVTSIGDYAFYKCENLTQVVVPDSTKDMGWGVFAYCTSLKSSQIV